MNSMNKGSRRIGIFGGSFNPIHNGHLKIAALAMERCDLSEVWFIPAGDPYMKDRSGILPAKKRFSLVEQAISGLPGFKADPIEILRDGPSYTADTLSALQKKHPDCTFYLILGQDAYLQLPLWKSPEKILEIAHLIVLGRKTGGDVPSYETEELRISSERLCRIYADIPISSTDIRRRIRNDQPIAGLVPETAEAGIITAYRSFFLEKTKESSMKKVYCRMGTPGQEVVRFEIPWAAACPEKSEIRVNGPFRETDLNRYLRESRGCAPGDVKEVSLSEGVLTIDLEPFTNRSDYTLKIGGEEIEKAAMDEVITEGLSAFERIEEGEVLYRLYSPKSTEKRPLILFLHGGGNGGTRDGRDNEKQLVADYGPINFSINYPEMYVLAPQCIEQPFNPMLFGGIRKQSFYKDLDPNFGWSRSYLTKVCDIIRRMIREGKVDEHRVYVTGLSMGGAGTIRATSVAPDLFAACAPVCPTMTQETFNILRTTELPVWVSSAYVDHTVYRHKYLVDAVMELKDRGNKDAHLTLYSPEELAEYDIGIVPDTDYTTLFSQNHASWVLTYHDAHGIMSWLLNRKK